jgi:prepilin-type N-terminal cleavage/methylation domain-containing protein/prepilin-type processing-associated H-X9-DG protein
MTPLTRNRAFPAFSLVELLVVIAIISLLVSLTLPSLTAARDHARAVVCLQNLKQIQISANAYAGEYKDTLVPVMGRGAAGRVMSYTACSPPGVQQNSSSGYNLSFMDLLNPNGIDFTNNEPLSHNPMWYCPGDIPWRKWGSPIVREVNYAMNSWLSHFKTASASDGLVYFKTNKVINPSDKAFIIESHHKGNNGYRSSDLQLYSQNNNSTVMTLAMAPSNYYATGLATSHSPRRHLEGFNASYVDGHANFITIPHTPVWSDGASTEGGLTPASWSASAATVWFDPSGTYFNNSTTVWKTLWNPLTN